MTTGWELLFSKLNSIYFYFLSSPFYPSILILQPFLPFVPIIFVSFLLSLPCIPSSSSHLFPAFLIIFLFQSLTYRLLFLSYTHYIHFLLSFPLSLPSFIMLSHLFTSFFTFSIHSSLLSLPLVLPFFPFLPSPRIFLEDCTLSIQLRVQLGVPTWSEPHV